jgi:hypothetical protein
MNGHWVISRAGDRASDRRHSAPAEIGRLRVSLRHG